MSTICLFWEGSHETEQARGLNKDHCFTAGQKEGRSFSWPLFSSTPHGCHLTPLTQKRHHHSATSPFIPKRSPAFKGSGTLASVQLLWFTEAKHSQLYNPGVLVNNRGWRRNSFFQLKTKTFTPSWNITKDNCGHLSVMWAPSLCSALLTADGLSTPTSPPTYTLTLRFTLSATRLSQTTPVYK